MSYGGGAAIWAMAVPEKQSIVIVLTNLQGASPQDMPADIATIYDPSLVVTAH